MTTRADIITLPHPSLRKKSAKIHVITDETLQLIQDMKDATIDWENTRPHEVAVGLAAVQIDRLERVVIIREDFDDKSNQNFTVLINPEIIKYEGDVETKTEGCLSVKDLYCEVERYEKVRLKAIDETGREFRAKVSGFLASIIQHEVDHVNGLCIVDRVKDGNEKAFYKLNDSGDLEPLAYDHVKASGILR